MNVLNLHRSKANITSYRDCFCHLFTLKIVQPWCYHLSCYHYNIYDTAEKFDSYLNRSDCSAPTNSYTIKHNVMNTFLQICPDTSGIICIAKQCAYAIEVFKNNRVFFSDYLARTNTSSTRWLPLLAAKSFRRKRSYTHNLHIVSWQKCDWPI